jgi:rare lipoprotein A
MTVLRPTAALALALLAAGCATRAPTALPTRPADGPEANPPPDLMRVPDALPRLEPIRDGGPNKPYAALGESYVPLRPEASYSEAGLASWYGRAFHGRRTASGELYNMYAMTAAHKTLPIPSYARVTNPANGRSVIVRVNDRGPFVRGRIIDLSYTAALKLDALGGVVPVKVERLTPEAITGGAGLEGTALPRSLDGDDVPAPVAPAAPPSPGAGTPREQDEAAQRAQTPAGRGFWVQLGAFRNRGGALQLQQQAAERIDGLALWLAVFSEASLHRVQAGPFGTRDEAARMADRVRESLMLVPLVVERR